MRFRWRRALHEVVAAEGPERIEGAWWSEHGGPARDYFRVEDARGLRFWLFRAGLYRDMAQAPRLEHAHEMASWLRDAALVPARDVCVSLVMTRYIEFAAASNFSFLRGASHPEELMLQASALGLSGLGLCDRNSVAGVVRAHLIRREQKLALAYHPGARLVFADGTPDILVYPRDRAGWGRLCRLLTRGNLRAEKGECILTLDDLLEHIDGLELIVMERSTWELPSLPVLRRAKDKAGEALPTTTHPPPHPSPSRGEGADPICRPNNAPSYQ